MTGRTWLITGVSLGLGRALAVEALQRGERVWGAVRSPAAREAFLALGAAGASLADMSDAAGVTAAVRDALSPKERGFTVLSPLRSGERVG